MTEDSSYGLVLPFLRDDLAFAEGVEVGMFWMELKRRPKVHRQFCLLGNQDVLLLAADRQGYEVVKMRPWGTERQWFYLKLRRRETAAEPTPRATP